MSRRVLAIAAATAAVGAILVPSLPAQAYSRCPANTACGWIYYSDAARTQEVGGHTTNCQGVLLIWGVQQGYSEYIQDNC